MAGLLLAGIQFQGGGQATLVLGQQQLAGSLRVVSDAAVVAEDVAVAIRDFTKNQGVHVWYETQREPDLMRTVDLMARRGRIVIMAGRQAQPVFPVGPFYTRDLSLFGFAMFNAPADEQRRCAEDINRWLAERKLHPQVGKVFPLSEASAAHRLQEENTLHKAGTLAGKIVVTPGVPA